MLEAAMAGRSKFFFLLCVCCSSVLNVAQGVCEESGQAIACSPPLEEDIISGLQPLTNDSCGLDGPQRFCILTSENRTRCEYCDASIPAQSHPPSLITDDNLSTFWLSFDSPALLTFPLGSSFRINSISITFTSRRPESFAIYRSTDDGKTFEPFRYYSVSCGANESDVLCSSEEAGMSSSEPVIFQPIIEGYSATATIATHIQIKLNNFPTETDYYAISDVRIAGACFCNGHADSCAGSVIGGDVMCNCQHGTSGRQCEMCSQSYQSLPWVPASVDSPTICLVCPTCYDQVAVEFNETQLILASLISHLNSSIFTSDTLPSDILRELQEYQNIIEMMLERAIDLTAHERNLSSLINTISMETDELDDMIGWLERNVSLSEEELEQIKRNAELAMELLIRLNENVRAVERSVRGDLLISLNLINQRIIEINNIFSDLVNLSILADNTSQLQISLAQDLLLSTNESFVTASEILDILHQAIRLQNNTTLAVEQLELEHMKTEVVFANASSGLTEIQDIVSSVLNQSKELLERLSNTSVTEYDTSDLESDIIRLRNLTAELNDDTTSLSSELVAVEEEVESVRVRAGSLLAEADEINMLAIELLARAHAAFSFANLTVDEGNVFIESIEQLLLQLQQRLENSSGLIEGLDEVVQNLLLAEELVVVSEEEEKKKREEVNNALLVAEEAVATFENTSQFSLHALQVSLDVRSEAQRILFNATVLANNVKELEENVSQLDERGVELVGVALESAELIAMATDEAEKTVSESRRLQKDINNLTMVVKELEVELNSTELLPSNRLSEVGVMVTELEEQADINQLTLDSLQNQVTELEESSDVLRERHTQLQQHRDLLQSILNNIQNLDCRNQFQSI